MAGINGCKDDRCELPLGHPGPHEAMATDGELEEFAGEPETEEPQKGLDWEAAERAAIAEADEEPAAAPPAEPEKPKRGRPPKVKEAPAPVAPGTSAAAPVTMKVPPPSPEKIGKYASVRFVEENNAIVQPAGSAVAPLGPKERLQSMAEMLAKVMPRVRAAVPAHVKPERLFQVAYLALSRQPALLECSAISVLRGVVIGAQLGLDISGIGGMAYLVPFYNSRTREKEVQFIIGYRGMIELARRSGDVAWIYPGIVYANEQFDYQVNPIPRLQHVPILQEDARGPMIGAYAIAVFRDASVPPMPWAMTKAQIDKIRGRSQAKDNGPWVSHYPEMAMKTAIRGLAKYIPASSELNQALDYEDQVESGGSLVLAGELPDSWEAPASDGQPAPEPPRNPLGGTAAIARKLEGKA